MITVLVNYERISLFHTMDPFFQKQYRRFFRFTPSADYCLTRDKNRILFMERWFKNDLPPDLNLMKRLREKYDQILFFDGYAAAGTHLLEVLPYVDRLFHKSVFTDRSHYLKPLYAKRLFADYYHRKYHIVDSNPEYSVDLDLSPQDADRIELSWSIGVGDYPRRHRPQRIGTGLARYVSPDLGRLFKTGHSRPPENFAASRRHVDVHSRIGLVSSETVTQHRKLYLEKIGQDPRFARGSVPQNQYYAELEDSKIVFSPFGWGEVCFRDFEAIVAGAMLLKPDMSHLVTSPDVYIPYETYVPVDWDGEDLMEKAEEYLKNHQERTRIARNAWDQYQKERERVNRRLGEILQETMDR